MELYDQASALREVVAVIVRDILTLDGLYKILIVPSEISLGSFPKAFFSPVTIEADGVCGFGLSFSRPAAAGRLHYKVYLRTFPYELHLGKGTIEESENSGALEIEAGVNAARLTLPIPLVSPQPREKFNRRYELILLFEPKQGASTLTLASPPEPDYFAKASAAG